MTEVEFHTGVTDPIGFACRLLRKAQRQASRVLVTAPPDVLAELDRGLWAIEERDFLPHVRIPGTAAAVATRTPIWLAENSAAAAGPGAPRLLLNLGATALPDFSALDRLIEIVASDPDAAERGRGRWRAYKAAGLQIKHHARSALRE